MAKIFFKLTLPLCFVASVSFGQADTLIYAEGKIINAVTKEPIKAKITYQSLPYGNRIGTLNNNTYSFPMFDKERYSIVVESPGFSPAKYMLDPGEANGDRKVIKDIELTVGSSADSKKHEVGQVMRLDNLIFQLGKSKISPE